MKVSLKNLVGFILCLISSLLIFYFFILARVLIILPLIIFTITIFIKNRKVSFILNSIIPIFFVIVFIRMRVPTSDNVILNSRVRYQLIDFGQGDIVRNALEYGLNNRRIFLQDTINGIKWIYVDSKDFKNLWPEPPFDMRAKNYTIKAKFKVEKLLFGGYSKATLIEYNRLNENPMITK